MIKRLFTENLALKGLSLILGFVIWLMVVNVSKPEINDSKSVPIEVKNANIFEADSKTWSIDRTNVTVTYNVRSDMRSAITSTDFHAYVDLSDYSITGSVPIYIEVLNGKDTMIGEVQVHPSVAKVTIENVQKKKFDIKAHSVGDPKSGYKVANIILSPESVYVTGPESEIGRISTVGVEVDTAGISTNQDGTAKLVYYDANGNVLSELQEISSNIDEISYSITVHKEKNINLLSSVSGTPAKGYQYESTTVSPDSVTLASTPGIIDTMTVFELPEIDLDGVTESINVTFDLSQLLPAGIELADEQEPQVNVLVRIEKLPDAASAPDNDGDPEPGPMPGQHDEPIPAPPDESPADTATTDNNETKEGESVDTNSESHAVEHVDTDNSAKAGVTDESPSAAGQENKTEILETTDNKS